jgi:hypothetical protein
MIIGALIEELNLIEMCEMLIPDCLLSCKPLVDAWQFFFALCNLSLFVQICGQIKLSQPKQAQAMPVLIFLVLTCHHQISVSSLG